MTEIREMKYKLIRAATPLMLALTAVLITVTGIIFRQSVLRILPLYVSLSVSFFQARVNRTAFLIGALNSLLYAAVYFGFKLYASAFYAIAFSFTLQLITYFRWKRNPREKATYFRSLNGRQRLLMSAVFAACGGLLWLILSAADSGYRIFDISVTLLGILSAVFALFPYIEYLFLTIAGSVINIFLYISMLPNYPAQITYLIYTVFSLTCQITALKRAMRLYRNQNN